MYFPYLIMRGKWHSGFKMRCGDFPPTVKEALHNNEHIWVHAVSMGEVLAVKGLVKKLSELPPRYKIVCSTVTETGYRMARDNLGDVCTVIYAPLDFSWIVHKFVRLIRPRIYVAVETEIWPNLYTVLHHQRVPIIQVNGRISDKAYRGYKRVRFLLARILAYVDRFCMQSALDAERIRALGAIPEKVTIAGNLKFENIPLAGRISKKELGFKEHDRLLVAGSTHSGEEEILTDIYARLKAEFEDLRLIIVPRHIERTGEVLKMVRKKGLEARCFSENRTANDNQGMVVVVDTIGQLQKLYPLAKVVFVGKSLMVGGGQNMIEPAVLGKPTIVGPMTQNFKDIVKILIESGGLIQVKDAQALYAAVRELLIDPQKAGRVGEAARRTVESHQGAILRSVEAIQELLVK
jgi:3-deoxy-D-manno-octulosonic-acid transferase